MNDTKFQNLVLISLFMQSGICEIAHGFQIQLKYLKPLHNAFRTHLTHNMYRIENYVINFGIQQHMSKITTNYPYNGR